MPFSYLTFATGNSGKYREAAELLPGLKHLAIELPELQDIDSKKIIAAKLRALPDGNLKNVFVEDVALHFHGIGGLPGPFVKWFLKALQARGLYELAQRTGDLRAEAVASIGLIDGKGREIFVEGRVPGTLVPPRGNDGFGWDSIFQPAGHAKTYAEMSDVEKGPISHRGKAIEKLKEHLRVAQSSLAT